jgi:hypothetical protein
MWMSCCTEVESSVVGTVKVGSAGVLKVAASPLGSYLGLSTAHETHFPSLVIVATRHC